ncbi:hypothetical protein EI94DRAFT_1209663 [Lactarius quietus]|nr:hypothetical protein EI94DRAFT_1209663 [Lactarius quietus]
MGPSLTIPPFPTSSIPLSSSPSLLPPIPSSFLFPLNAVSQNIIMSGAVRNKGAGAQHAPRPPNAWILYRSDKLQQLPHPLSDSQSRHRQKSQRSSLPNGRQSRTRSALYTTSAHRSQSSSTLDSTPTIASPR